MPTNPTIIYDGIDLSGSAYGLLLSQAPLQGAPDYRIDVQAIPYRHGGVSLGSFTEPGEVECKARILGSNRGDVVLKAAQAFGVMHTDRERSLVFAAEGLAGRMYWGRLRRANFQRWIGINCVEYRLVFSTSDPTQYAVEESVEEEAIESDPDNFVFDVGGNLYTEPIWEFENTGASTAAGVVLSNTTSGESLDWGGTIAVGAKVRIDSKRWLVERDTGSGYVAVMGGLGSGHRFPVLLPGSNNITVAGLASADMVVRYRDRWLG